jgi:hypothetical protein
MTIQTLILLNGVLCFAVVGGIVGLLGLGIQHDRLCEHQLVRPLVEPELDRLAA